MLSVLVAALMQGATPAAAPVPNVIAQPVWVTIPSAAEFTALYPPAALRSRLEGRATIRCRIDGHGALIDCAVSQEDPPGAGFGDAALRIAALFRMSPFSQDGIRTSGGQISMPIRFKLPEEPTPQPVPTGAIVTNPDWEHKPAGEDLATVYPSHAGDNELEGFAIMQCAVAVDGNLSSCAIVSEDPIGEGFGAATLKLSPFFKMRPATRDGQPVGGGTVRIPIRYVLPEVATMDDIVITRPTFADGSATVDCRAQPKGIDNCWLVTEAPKDGGSGNLAMQLAPRLRPKVDSALRFRVRFIFKKGEASVH